MSAEPIASERMDDCLAVLLDAEELNLRREDILSISTQTGGLFNFLLRVETAPHGTFFFKQYLDNVPNPIYDPPKIPATERSLLACEVQRLASEATQSLGGKVVPRIVHFDRNRSEFAMTKAAGDQPLIELLSIGEIPDIILTQLPKALACLHQATYDRFTCDSFHANRDFRDFKLMLQYDGIVDKLDKKEAEIILNCKEDYRGKANCVTHGDINSRNIMVGPNTIGLIDFEQSHLGSPAYDLAYILSEVCISLNCFAEGTQVRPFISRFLDSYFECFNAQEREDVETEITTHLAVQILYRFWGPSRASWTFYVDDSDKERIIRHARSLLLQEGPVIELLN